MRRLLTVAFLAVLVTSSAAACGSTDDTSTGASSSTAASASPSASPSPTVDVKANTKAVCDKVEKIVSEDNFKAVGEKIGAVIGAKLAKNKTAQTKAEGEVKTQVDGLAAQIRALKAEAADPKLQTAIDTAADGVAVLGTPAYLAKLNTLDDLTKLQTDLTTAITPLGTICA